MAAIKPHKLEESIKKIIISAGLATLSSKKVRTQLEEKFGVDFTSRKKEIDGILMKMVTAADDDRDEENSSESSNEEENSSESSAESDSDDHKSPVKATKNPATRKRMSSPPTAKTKVKKPKNESNDTGEKVKKKTGFGKEMLLSEKLAALLGTDKLSRGDVVKQIYALVKERELLDPSNKQYVLCDDQLFQIFGVQRFRAFGMMKHLKNHIKDPKDL